MLLRIHRLGHVLSQIRISRLQDPCQSVKATSASKLLATRKNWAQEGFSSLACGFAGSAFGGTRVKACNHSSFQIIVGQALGGAQLALEPLKGVAFILFVS